MVQGYEQVKDLINPNEFMLYVFDRGIGGCIVAFARDRKEAFRMIQWRDSELKAPEDLEEYPVKAGIVHENGGIDD